MGKEYDPKAYYTFRDSEGNILFTARGDEDPLIEESITKGLPISTDSDGTRYIYPYGEVVNGELILHFPSWFKETNAYTEWKTVWAPTLPYSTFDTETMNAINDVLGKLGERAAAEYLSQDSYYTTTTEDSYKPTQTQESTWYQTSIFKYSIIAISILLIIAVAVAFTKSVKKKIKQRDEFSGIGWALANAIVGLGIVGIPCVIIANKLINKEIDATRSTRYKKYAKRQMGDFVITYTVCFLIKIVAVIIINLIRYKVL